MIYAICIPMYLGLLLFHKKLGFLFYELFTATIYLITLSYDQTLDITLVLYMIFAAAPYIKYLKVYVGFSAYLLAYYIVHVLLSAVLNGFASSISVFCVRLAGLFMFYYIFQNIDFEREMPSKFNWFGYVCATVICEIIIYVIGASLTTSSTGRLMLNYQCTVGCIATSTLILLAYFLHTEKTHTVMTIAAMLILTALACASGTRGYIVVSLAVTFVSLFLKANVKWRIIISIVAVVILMFAFQFFEEVLLVDLRMGSSTGRRESENLFVLKFMWLRPFFVWLFGNGFGAVVGDYPIADGILAAVSDSSYTYLVLHTVTGFHNLYVTVLYSAGIVGLIMILIAYLKMVRCAVGLNVGKHFKMVLITFFASYAFLLWYRWTATSGILEFSCFAYIIGAIKIGGGTS